MKHSSIINGLTHGAALGLGVLAWTAFRPISPVSSSAATTIAPEARGAGLSPEQVFSSLKSGPAAKGDQRAHDDAMAEFERLAATIEVPDDFAAALSGIVADWRLVPRDERRLSPEIMALMYHWAAKDLPAMLKWAEASDAATDALMWHSFPVYEKVARDQGPEALVSGVKGSFGLFAAHILTQQLGESADASQVLAIRESLDAPGWEQVRKRLAANWPMDRREALAEIARAEGRPELLIDFAGKQGAAAVKWLAAMAENPELDADFRDQLVAADAWKALLRQHAGTSLEQRIATATAGDAGREGEALEQIARNDLGALLKDGRDWRYAFRHGDVDAAEVLAAVTSSLPELATAHPSVLKQQLFQQLVEEDPGRAMALLDGLPADERHRIALDAAGRMFNHVDPEIFLTALRDLPADTPQQWDARLAAWNRKSTVDARRLSEDYVTWVRALPAGLDREMALFSLAGAVEDPALAAELRAEIQDERLKGKEGR
jgi:hypothetical protein